MYKKRGKNLLAQLIIQNPPESYVKAINKLNQWISGELIFDEKCIMDDENCDNQKGIKNQAIKSHAISKKKNLRRISKSNSVKVLGHDYRSPNKRELKNTAIKSATTFPGFCGYHDKKIFEPIEGKDLDVFSSEHIFLYCFRALAYTRFLSLKEYKTCKLLISNITREEVYNARKETLDHEYSIKRILSNRKFVSCKLYKDSYYVLRSMLYLIQLLKVKSINKYNYKVCDKYIKLLKGKLINTEYDCFKTHIITSPGTSIAYTKVFLTGKHDILIFVNILPISDKTKIMISALNKDEKILRAMIAGLDDTEILANIQSLIDSDDDNIIFGGDLDDDSLEAFYYTTGNATSKMFKKNFF